MELPRGMGSMQPQLLQARIVVLIVTLCRDHGYHRDATSRYMRVWIPLEPSSLSSSLNSIIQSPSLRIPKLFRIAL